MERNRLILVDFLLALLGELLRRHELFEEESHEALFETHFDHAVLVDFLEIAVSVMVAQQRVLPCDVLEAAVSENEVLTRRKVVVGLLSDSFYIQKTINDLWSLKMLSNHEEDVHHEAHLVPQEGRSLDDTLVDGERRALLVALNQLGAEREDAAHEVLLPNSLFIFVISMTCTHGDAVVFLAKVAEVVQADKLLSTLGHQLDIELLGKEEVVVLAEDAAEARIERLRHNTMAKHADVCR